MKNEVYCKQFTPMSDSEVDQRILSKIESAQDAVAENQKRVSSNPRNRLLLTMLKPVVNETKFLYEMGLSYIDYTPKLRKQFGYGKPTEPLQLRKHFPNIVPQLSNQVRIPKSKRKFTIPLFRFYLSREVNIHNDEDFFNGLLDILEENPARMELFEGAYLAFNLPDDPGRNEVLDDIRSNFPFRKIGGNVSKKVMFYIDCYQNLERYDILGANVFQLFLNYAIKCAIKIPKKEFFKFFEYLNDYINSQRENELEVISERTARTRKSGNIRSKGSRADKTKIFATSNKSKSLAVPKIVKGKELSSGPATGFNKKDSNKSRSKNCNASANSKSQQNRDGVPAGKINPALLASPTEITVAKKIPSQITVDRSEYQTLTSELIRNGLISIAGLFTEALEVSGQSQVLPSQCLKLAAESRVSFEILDGVSHNFDSMIEDAVVSSAGNELANGILFGALLQPAILQPVMSARESLGRLYLKNFDPSVAEFAKSVAKLNFAFQPTIDDFIRHGKLESQPLCDSSVDKLGHWYATTVSEKIPCPDTSFVLRELTRKGGEIHNVIDSLKQGISPKVIHDAKLLIANLYPEKLAESTNEDVRIRFLSNSKHRLAPKFRKFIARVLEEGRACLTQWIEIASNVRSKHSDSREKNAATIDMLIDSADRVLQNLEDHCDNDNALHKAVCHWIVNRVSAIKSLLECKTTTNSEGAKLFTRCELDHIAIDGTIASKHLQYKESLDKEGNGLDRQYLIKYLKKHGVPTTVEAIHTHLENKAFHSAVRLAQTIPIPHEREGFLLQICNHRDSAIESTLDRIRKQIRQFENLLASDPKNLDHLRERIELLEIFAEVLSSDDAFDFSKILNSEASSLTNEFTEVDQILRDNARFWEFEKCKCISNNFHTRNVNELVH